MTVPLTPSPRRTATPWMWDILRKKPLVHFRPISRIYYNSVLWGKKNKNQKSFCFFFNIHFMPFSSILFILRNSKPMQYLIRMFHCFRNQRCEAIMMSTIDRSDIRPAPIVIVLQIGWNYHPIPMLLSPLSRHNLSWTLPFRSLPRLMCSHTQPQSTPNNM